MLKPRETNDNKRPVRPSALKAQKTFLSNGQGTMPPPSSEDDEGAEAAAPPKPAPRSSRKGSKVDLSKLETGSLQRYRKHWQLSDTPASLSKEGLLASVSRHFTQQVLDEDEVLIRFLMAVHKTTTPPKHTSARVILPSGKGARVMKPSRMAK